MNREIYVTDGVLTICPASENDKGGLLRNLGRDIAKLAESLSVIGLEMKISVAVDGINYSIFDEKNKYCGNIIIENPSSATPEIGINLVKAKRNKGIALRATRLVAKRFYEENKVDYFLLKASAENTHSRHMIEKTGAVFTGMEESPYKKILKKCIASVSGSDCEGMKSRFEKELEEYKNMPDNVCVYKLMPESFI